MIFRQIGIDLSCIAFDIRTLIAIALSLKALQTFFYIV